MARAAVGNGDMVVGIKEGGGIWFLSSASTKAASCGMKPGGVQVVVAVV